jgi:hypothetical protein
MLGLITKMRVIALTIAMAGTGFIGADFDMNKSEAFFGVARRVERRHARREARAERWGYGSYSGGGSAGSSAYGSYSGGGSSGAYGSYSNGGSAGSAGSSVYETSTPVMTAVDCPHCGRVE